MSGGLGWAQPMLCTRLSGMVTAREYKINADKAVQSLGGRTGFSKVLEANTGSYPTTEYSGLACAREVYAAEGVGGEINRQIFMVSRDTILEKEDVFSSNNMEGHPTL
jgi:hypothetical protein